MQKRQKRENKSFFTRLLSLVVVVLLIATAAVRDGKPLATDGASRRPHKQRLPMATTRSLCCPTVASL